MATYTYNPDGLRRSKHVVLTLEQRFIWSGGSMVYECELLYPNNGTVYVYGINLISSRNSTGNSTFYLYNAHGNVVQLVDADGIIAQTYNYDAFGVEYDIDEDDDNPFRYCGEYFDKETGTIYLRARYYDSATGRFTSEDPIGAGLNWYTYCHNDPVNFIDPNGLQDVMLGYIAEKNGGSVEYTYDRFLWILWKTNEKFTVTINGITKEYTKDEVRFVNGQMVIDSELLMEDFGLTIEQATHLEGDLFDSEEDAVMAFGLMYYQKSLDEKQEYGAVINKDKDERYSFNNVSNSSNTYNKSSNTLTDKERNSVAITLDDNSVAAVHTHWRPNGNLNFSNPADYNMPSQIKSMYLINRKGQVMYSTRTKSTNNINGFKVGKKLFNLF